MEEGETKTKQGREKKVDAEDEEEYWDEKRSEKIRQEA